MIWCSGKISVDLSSPKVLGVVNITPDSFFDGGRYYQPSEAVRRVHKLVSEGAAVIDLGAESTRPGATPLTWDAEWERLEKVFALLSKQPLAVPLSVDTYHPETARRALTAGASVINCVYPEPAMEMLELANEFGCGLILPCRTPESIRTYRSRLTNPAQLIIDPEIGFDTTREEDIALLQAIPSLANEAPVCLGVSHKRIIRHLVGAKASGKDLAGSVALALWGTLHGAAVLRVHDVAETIRSLSVFTTLSAKVNK